MTESTARPAAGPTAVCIGCKKPTDFPIVVRWIAGDSGPGYSQLACPSCTAHLLRPDEIWRLAVAHMVGCSVCRGDGPCERGQTLMDVRRAAREQTR